MKHKNPIYVSQDEQLSVEEYQRAMRVWSFLENENPPVLIKDVRREMGLSYRQARRALEILKNFGIVSISVTADWNGCHYIYPHRIWVWQPPSL